MKSHSDIGASMIKNLSDFQDEPLLKASYEICRWHHERYDGRGYPDGLKGDEIPISAQIVSIADVYDALNGERCYKKAYSHEKALEMICGGECGSFNPLILKCLLDIGDKLKTALQNNSLDPDDRWELQELTDEIINNDDLSSSGQILRQIEFERSKSEFFAAELPEIFFSYQSTPPVLTISENGAERLGISRVIADPLANEEVNKIRSASLDSLIDKLSSATSENPDVSMEVQIKNGSEENDCEIHCRTLWTSADSPEYAGVAGTIFCRKN